MKCIAIHNGLGWNVKWIEYCKENNIPYKAVNCFDSDIINQIRECSGLMWQFAQTRPSDILVARNVLNAAELMGLKVYPNFHTNWHYDDKLSQKYLFESLNLPAAPSWAFFNEEEALNFSQNCEVPIVAKLRRGAGSYNVKLLKTRGQIRKYIKRMFGQGYSPAPAPLADVKTKFKVAIKKGGIHGVLNRLKKAPNFFKVMLNARKYFGNEKGYVYFQKFIPGNTCDLRITVVGNRAWGFHRIVRENDFRASGSGMIDYDVAAIPLEIVRKSFDISRKFKMQSICFDWVHDAEGNYYFVEISYAFVDEAVYNCEGFWDDQLNWHKKHYYPTYGIMEDFLASL
jgi:glutathione synthase/RimK-type ligase-like ATP-grasp enzyme